MKNFKNIPILGSGIGFRKGISAELNFDNRNIDFVDIVGEHFLSLSSQNKADLNEIQEKYTIIPHFIGLSLGSAEGVDDEYIDKIANFLDFIDTPYRSEHIAFTECHGIEIGHLTPIPYSQEAVDVFTKNINKVKSIIKTPFILENISYTINDPIQEMSESEFINLLFKTNEDVGMLSDITNLYVNATNHYYDYKAWLNSIDLRKVIQIHYVGVSKNNGLLIDNHSHATQDPIWKIMNEIAKHCPNLKGSILERDNNMGDMDDLRLETARAKNILF